MKNWADWCERSDTPDTPRRAADFGFFALCWNLDFRCLFGANLAPTFHPKTTKIHQKSDFSKLPKLHRFFDQFSYDLALSWGLSWGHVGAQIRTKTALDPPQEAFWGRPGGVLELYCVLEPSRSPLEPLKAPPGTHFSYIFRQCFNDVLKGFLVAFSLIYSCLSVTHLHTRMWIC